jgi:hypothetical protein
VGSSQFGRPARTACCCARSARLRCPEWTRCLADSTGPAARDQATPFLPAWRWQNLAKVEKGRRTAADFRNTAGHNNRSWILEWCCSGPARPMEGAACFHHLESVSKAAISRRVFGGRRTRLQARTLLWVAGIHTHPTLSIHTVLIWRTSYCTNLKHSLVRVHPCFWPFACSPVTL